MFIKEKLNSEISKKTGLMNNNKWSRLFIKIDEEINHKDIIIKLLLMNNEVDNLSELSGKITKNGISDICPTGSIWI